METEKDKSNLKFGLINFAQRSALPMLAVFETRLTGCDVD